MRGLSQVKRTYIRSMGISLVLAGASILTLISCSRGENGQSRLEITLPPHPSINAKSTNLNAQASEAPYCYLVNIVGEGLTSTPSKCYPNAGVRSGFMPPLSTLTLDVPKGSQRRVELYGYIPKTNETCASSGLDLQSVPLNRLFRLGLNENVEMNADEVVVRIEVVYPGITQHVGVQTRQPAECYSHLPPIDLSSTPLVVSDVIKGGRFQIVSEISSEGSQQTQTGSRFRIEYEVQNVQ